MSYIKVDDKPFIYFDIDNTLIKHYSDDITEETDSIQVEYNRVIWNMYPMYANILLISELRACGYQIACWSQSGSDHTERVIKALKLEDLVDLIVPKPRFYVDDKPFEDQGIQRIWKK